MAAGASSAASRPTTPLTLNLNPCIGGHDGSWRSLRSSETYDPLLDMWTPGPALPSGVSFAGCATLRRGEVVLVSGRVGRRKHTSLFPK